jgi:hypothetical protein
MLTYSNLYLYTGKYELYKFPELADQEQFKCRVQLQILVQIFCMNNSCP